MSASLFIIFFVFAFLGVPIAVALLAAAIVPLYFFTTTAMTVVPQRVFVSMDSFSLMALPFFMIAGGLMAEGGVSRRLVNFANSIVGGLPGGLAIVAFVASAFMGAISGSATATVIAIGSIVVPAMIEAGYDKRFAVTTCSVAGFLGTIIPPSIPMVTYSVTTGASTGDVFSGGIIPGCILVVLMSIWSFSYGKRHVKTNFKFSLYEVFRTFIKAIWSLLMPLIILGGIYGGIFTPTEAAAVACLYGLLVGFFIYRELTLKKLYKVMKDSVVSASMVMFIVAAAAAFGFVMTKASIPVKMSNWIISITDSKILLLLLINLLLLFIGTFMETNAAILIVAPIFIPICEAFGIDLVHFGVMMIVNLSIGIVTPPLGVNLFVGAKLIEGLTVKDVINRHLFIYIGLALIGLLIITFVEGTVLFLPNLVK
ncbi:TRAP transporter large permease [Anaerotignum sp.]|uniref:TRAP transporter large permease n=1 Tax=Anaerotignum sp. TaxID=2039241 RepID=UPI003735A277